MNYKNHITFMLVFLAIFSKPLLVASEKADYIVIGVGTAGATISKLLSDDQNTSVIALHTGKNLTQNPDIKYSQNAIFTVLSTLTGIDFSQIGFTPPQPNVDDRELVWAIATPEGGASSINAGAWSRGTDQLYAQWEPIAGPEWSTTKITAIYKSLENYNGATTNPAARGFKGPVDVRQVPTPTTFDLKFTQAEITATSLPFVLDYNDPATPIGISSQMQNTQSGPDGTIRVSSATAFLNRSVITPDGKGVGSRRLQVKFQSTALRTIWKGNKAIGVEYFHKGKIKKVYAKKGVIVCGGLYSSAFLMHSGVGPKEVLLPLGIKVKYDNPNVGVLADQTLLGTIFLTNPNDTPITGSSCGHLPGNIAFDNFDPSFLFNVPKIPDSNIQQQLIDFILCNGSLFPGNSIFSQIAWLPSPGGDPTIRKIRISTSNPIPGLAFAIVDLVQPESRGRITLNSFNPFDAPVISSGMFSNPNDLALYIQAFQIYIKNINNALHAMDQRYELVFPPPAILDDIELLTAFIKEVVAPCQCWQCHCRMAPLNQGGVVNSIGQVYGVENLYVADNSINPVAMDGTPMATGYLIAANIARLLLQQ